MPTSAATRLAPPPLAARVLAPGADAALLAALGAWLARFHPERVLDVGVGTRSLLHALGCRAIGLDLAPRALQAFRSGGGTAVAGNAVALPFPDGAFDAVASIGLLHHLPDDAARAALTELVRVAGAHGRVALFDAVLPEPAWRRPFAWAIRRADRGRYVRRAAGLRALLPEPARWRTRRFTYARTGLEGLWCTRR